MPSDATLTRSTVSVSRSYTKTSNAPFVSPGTRLEADESNATNRPLELIVIGRAIPLFMPLPWVPSDATLTRSTVSASRSYTNTSEVSFVSPGTKLEAHELKATNRPSELIDGYQLPPLPSVPSDATLTRSTVSVSRSYTKTSNAPFVSPGTRFDAEELNATNRPSALIDSSLSLSSFPSDPSDATLTRSTVSVPRSYTKTSDTPFVSPGTRFEADDTNATYRPSELSHGK